MSLGPSQIFVIESFFKNSSWPKTIYAPLQCVK